MYWWSKGKERASAIHPPVFPIMSINMKLLEMNKSSLKLELVHLSDIASHFILCFIDFLPTGWNNDVNKETE